MATDLDQGSWLSSLSDVRVIITAAYHISWCMLWVWVLKCQGTIAEGREQYLNFSHKRLFESRHRFSHSDWTEVCIGEVCIGDIYV